MQRFTGNIIKNEKYPFRFFIIKNVFDSKFYKDIRADILKIFNNPDIFAKIMLGKKDDKEVLLMGGGDGYISKEKNEKVKMSYEDSLSFIKAHFSNSKHLTSLLQYFNSQDFCDFINYKILNKNKFSLKKLNLIQPNEKIGLFDFLFYKSVFLSIKLSKYEENSVIYPHRDASQKLYAFLFYLGFSDNIKRDFGGTQFYKVKNDAISKENIKSTDHLPDSLNYLSLLHDMRPNENSFCGFEVGNLSWHGVSHLKKLPKDCYRINLQINLMKCIKYTLITKILVVLLRKLKILN